jgi:hypothetical protein
MERYPDLYKTKKNLIQLEDGTLAHLDKDLLKITDYESLSKDDLIGKPYDYSTKSKGLGDTIEKITKFLGIQNLIHKMTREKDGKDCGCGTRKDKLNKMFPYKK